MTDTTPNVQTGARRVDCTALLAQLFKEHGVKPHPVFRLPAAEELAGCLLAPGGLEQFVHVLRQRGEIIVRSEADPLRYGYEPPMWKDADRLIAEYRRLAVVGPNRIGKTEWAAKRVMRKSVAKPGSRWWCLCQSNETSIRGGGQQEVVWKYFPPEWKALKGKRGLARASIHYNDKTRFAENSVIGPEGQEIRFMNYEQDIKIIEGGAIDGYWADELVPVEWVNTLDGRLVDRAGEGIVTFTPIYGWTETLGLFIQGGTVAETRDFPLFPEMKIWPGLKPGQIPYIIFSVKNDRATIFFQLKQNPFVSWEALVNQWKAASTKEQLIRLAGVTQKTTGNRFPKFGKAHIVSPALIPTEGTNYHVMDFAWNRNWSMLWARVQRIKDKRRIFIYREWPTKKEFGEWVIRSSKPNGTRGPAQNPIGLGISGYKQLILQLEGHRRNVERGTRNAERTGNAEIQVVPEEIYLRYGDPRSGKAAAITAEEGGTSIIDMMLDEQPDAPPMEVIPARGVLIGEGINVINEWLSYNDELPVDAMNEPTVFISEECENLIDCLQIWTGQGTEKEQASKDFIDLFRYLAVEDIDAVDVTRLGASGGGSY